MFGCLVFMIIHGPNYIIGRVEKSIQRNSYIDIMTATSLLYKNIILFKLKYYSLAYWYFIVICTSNV